MGLLPRRCPLGTTAGTWALVPRAARVGWAGRTPDCGMPRAQPSPPEHPLGAESRSAGLPAVSAVGAPGGQACPSPKDGQARDDVSNDSGLQPPRRPNSLRWARGKTRAFHALMPRVRATLARGWASTHRGSQQRGTPRGGAGRAEGSREKAWVPTRRRRSLDLPGTLRSARAAGASAARCSAGRGAGFATGTRLRRAGPGTARCSDHFQLKRPGHRTRPSEATLRLCGRAGGSWFRGAQPARGPHTCSGTGDGRSWAPLRPAGRAVREPAHEPARESTAPRPTLRRAPAEKRQVGNPSRVLPKTLPRCALAGLCHPRHTESPRDGVCWLQTVQQHFGSNGVSAQRWVAGQPTGPFPTADPR